MLWNWTDQGIRNAKDSPQRYDTFKKDLEKAGGKLVGGYYRLYIGQDDGVVILEAPNDEVVMKIMLSTASLGNIRTKTLKAIPHEEGAKLMQNL
jgi:uncharacterized protein with GYD domain